jgi:hypothetical protein
VTHNGTSSSTFFKAILNGYHYFAIHENSLIFGHIVYRWAGCCELRDVADAHRSDRDCAERSKSSVG